MSDSHSLKGVSALSVKVEDNRITMTRGDTLRVKIGIIVDGEEYFPEAGDVVRFAVKHPDMNPSKSEYKDAEPLILKTIPNETQILELEPSDTKPYGFGKYDYDIQITFADGTVNTFISDRLTLTKEVE